MSNNEITELEQEIFGLMQKLNELRKTSPGEEVRKYSFSTQGGETTLLDLFGDKDKLLVIHNMGQGCRYCTLWADGISALLPHLETAMSVVLVSKDEPALQRRMANERGWRFRMASHGGGDYISEQTTDAQYGNAPGVACYRRDNGRILRLGGSSFGPGDQYCALWPLLSLAGLGPDNWTPQFHYWKRPENMEDGGANLVD